MKKQQYLKGLFLGALALPLLSSCQQNEQEKTTAPVAQVESEQPFDPFMGRQVYLRGEMNEYGKQALYLLKKEDASTDRYCTLASLRSDWSPYRFKFADADWTSGTNFGYAMPPAFMREGSAQQQLNPNSRFEELRYAPAQDGVYRFCIVYKDKTPYASVEYLENAKLPSVGEFISQEAANI